MRGLLWRSGLRLLPALVLVFGAAVGDAHAYMSATGSGTASAGVSSLTSPGSPKAGVTAPNVSVTWTASTIGGAVAASSYTVERYDGSGVDLGEASCGAVPSSVGFPDAFGGFSCTDSPSTGTFKYKITAHYQSWTVSSGFTNSVTVGATATTVSSTANPSKPNQQVTYTATVTVEPAGTPTGKVRFLDGANTISGCSEQPLTTSSPYRASCNVTYAATGSHSITARYLGDSTYPSSTSSALTQTVAKSSQTISFEGLPTSKSFDEGPLTVKAKASSGLAVTFASKTTTVCTTSGGAGEKVTFLTTGTCTIKANQAGNEEWSSASEEQSFTITKGKQTITFAELPGKDLGEGSMTVAATASSGLAVTFASMTTTVCTTSGGAGEKVTFLTTGTCTIKAAQTGNTNWNAATPVERSFAITSAAATLTALSPASVGAGAGAVRVTVSPDGHNVYVTNGNAATISQYSRNTETGKLTALSPASVSAGSEPEDVVVSPDGANAYVANRGSNTVSQYSRNTSTGILTSIAPVAASEGPIGLTVSPDGKSVYATNSTSQTVSQYARNAETGKLTALSPATVPAGANAHAIVVSPDGKSAYVANYGPGTVAQYSRNTETGKLSTLSPATVTAGTNPHGITISPDGKSVYVTNNSSPGTVTLLTRDATTFKLTASTSFPAGTYSECVVVSPDGENVYATNEVSSNISQYARNGETGQLTTLSPATIATGIDPSGIAISADGKSVYAANLSSGSVSQYARSP